jgi:hypothetical protein
MDAALRINANRHLNDLSLYHHLGVIIIVEALKTQGLPNAREKLWDSNFPDPAHPGLLHTVRGDLSPSLLEIFEVFAEPCHYIILGKVVSIKLFKGY